MQTPLPKSTRLALIASGAVLALGLVASVALRQRRAAIRANEVAVYLDKAAGAGKVTFSGLRVAVTRQGDADLGMSVSATASATAPLYSKVDAADYLEGPLNLDLESTLEARRLIADKDASGRPEFARLRPFPPDPYRAVILRKTAQAGTAFPFVATLAAHHEANGWNLTLLSSGYVGAHPVGEPRPAFGDPCFVAGDSADDERLRAMAADLRSFAGRLSETRRNLEAAHAAAVSRRREAFMARVAPGSVFRGVALRAGDQQGTVLYLEITAVSPGRAVTAFLRNDGGWHYARPFQGSWLADDDFEVPMLNLLSQPGQSIRNAGPFLEYTQAWAFALRMDGKGDLSEDNGSYQYRFQFVNAGQVPSLKAALQEEFEQASSATAPGSLYRGTAVARASGASEPVLLRFTGRSQDGESIQAWFESTTRSWKRPLHGVVLGNSRRSDGEPILLRSNSREAVAEAPGDSVLGDGDDIYVRLSSDNGSLAGGDERFTYRFSALKGAELSDLDAARSARARRLGAILRDGIAYDGTIRDDQGSVTQARMEIGHVDRQGGAIAASIHSLVQLNVYQDFLGAWSPSDASISLVATGQGEFDFSDTLAVPFLVAPVPRTVELALVGDLITGAIKGDTHWVIEFPVGEFLAARIEGAEPDSPPAADVYPAFPRRAGAYLLSGGAWRPLPRNNGRLVVETIHPMTAEEASSGVLGVVSQGVRRLSQKGVKIPYLEFDGKDPRPASGGEAITLLFVGAGPSRTPPVEVAPVETLKDGRRGIEIAGDSPDQMQFGEQRVAAYVRKAGPGAVLLTATSALPAGTYAFNADAGYEFAVK